MFPFSRKPAKPTRTSNEQFPLCPFCQPLNRLEEALVEKYEGRIDLVRFLNVLLSSEVYLVTREDQVDVTDESFKLKPSPVLFTQELRGLHHLAVFTHVERGGVVPRINPEFSSSLPVNGVINGVRPRGFTFGHYCPKQHCEKFAFMPR